MPNASPSVVGCPYCGSLNISPVEGRLRENEQAFVCAEDSLFSTRLGKRFFPNEDPTDVSSSIGNSVRY